MRTVLLVTLFVLAACSSPHPNAVTNAQGHEVALYVTPGVSGEQNDVRVEVRGSRIPDISELSFTTPDMTAPLQRVALKEEGSGSYSAGNVRFSKAGTWHVRILERDGRGTREFASLNFNVR